MQIAEFASEKNVKNQSIIIGKYINKTKVPRFSLAHPVSIHYNDENETSAGWITSTTSDCRLRQKYRVVFS